MESKISTKNLKSHNLFVEQALWKAVLKVALPGLLISLMGGVYIFADQLLLALLIPTDGVHDFDSIFGLDQATMQGYLDIFNAAYPTQQLILFGSSDIVKSALSISAPITMLLNAMPYLAAVGAGVMYTQAIARNDKIKGFEIWKTSFWSAIFIGIISIIFFLFLNPSILTMMSGNVLDFNALPNAGVDQHVIDEIQKYYNTAQSTQIEWASQYISLLAIGSIFNVMIIYFSFMIRAEGRMAFVTIAAVLCNVLNIALDFVFIQVVKMGMAGGGIATLIGWIVNFGASLAYIWFLNFKNSTWMSFKELKFNKHIRFSWTMLSPILIIGMSVFLRNFSNAMAGMIFQPTLANLGNSISGQGQYYQVLSGAVMPIMNLFFYAIFGIVDGVRTLTAYNYSIGNYKRVKSSYWFTIGISVIYGLMILLFISVGLGPLLLSLFNIVPGSSMMNDASRYLIIQITIIGITGLSLGGMLIFQATNRLGSAILIALLQGLICFPITALIMGVLALNFSNIWLFIAVNAVNAGVAAIIISIYSLIFLYRNLGKRHFKIQVFVKNHNKLKTVRITVPMNAPKPSLAQRQLEKSRQGWKQNEKYTLKK